MKKQIVYIVCSIFALFVLMKTAPIQASSIDDNSRANFLIALEENLRSSLHYYHPNSASLIDGINFEGTVMKVVKKDDPKTEANEEVIEEYTANLVVAFVQLEQLRDELFIFEKTEIYYYDLDHNEFLISSHVFSNDKVKTFFDAYKNDITKHLSLFSEVLLLFIISFIITVPLFIMIFHNRNRSSSIKISLQE